MKGKARRVSSTPTTSNKTRKSKGSAKGGELPDQDEKVEIVPVSDVICTGRGAFPNDNKHSATDDEMTNVLDYVPPSKSKVSNKTCRFDYYGSLAVRHTTASAIVGHTISTGDIVAFSNTDYGAPEAPFSKDPWSVGQVVALVNCKVSPTEQTYFGVIQWLPRWKKEFLRDQTVPEKIRKEYKGQFRPDQALVESQRLFWVDIKQNILPVQVCLRGWKEFLTTKFIRPELIESEVESFDVFQVYYNCVLLHEKRQDNNSDDNELITFKDVRKEWDSYHVDRPSEEPSPVMKRSWALLQDQSLEEALQRNYKVTLELTATFGSYRSQWELNRAQRNGRDLDHEESSVEEEIFTVSKPKLNKAKRKKQIESVQQATHKRCKTTTVPSKKAKEKSAKRISFDLPSQTRNQGAAEIKRRKVEEGTDATRSKASKRFRGERDCQPLVFEAKEPAVYVYRPPNKISAKKTSSSNSRTSFYAAISCKVNPYQHYHEKFVGAQNKKTQKVVDWNIHIGDVVAVRSSKCKFDGHGTKDMTHYPFLEPWSVGQVLSISSATDEAVDPENSANQHFVLEIRWFCAVDDLNADVREDIYRNAPSHVRNSSCLIEMDEGVGRVSSELLLAPIQVTSTILPSSPKDTAKRRWKRPGSTMPYWTVSCQDFYESKHDNKYLYALKDWPSLNDKAEDSPRPCPDPVRRGLYCERAMPHKFPKLQKKYEMILRRRLAHFKVWDESEKLQSWAPTAYHRSGPESQQARYWTEAALNATANIARSQSRSDRLHVSNGKEFYGSLRVLALKERCDHRAVGKKADEIDFVVSLGQPVCVADNEAIMQNITSNSSKLERKLANNMFYPFAGPWTVYQIVALYKVKNCEGKNSQEYFMEGRRLFRPGEMPEPWLKYLPRLGNDVPQLFESNMVQDNLPVSRILGHVSLSLGPSYTHDSSQIYAKNMTPELTLHHHCSYYYNCTRRHLQPIYVADSCPKKWTRRFLERGLSFSEHCSVDQELRRVVECALSVRLEAQHEYRESVQEPQNDMFADIFQEMRVSCEMAESEERTESAFIRNPCGLDVTPKEFFAAVRIVPPFSKYQQVEKVCHPQDRGGRLWTIRVGDVIAVSRSSESGQPEKENSAQQTEEHKYFPFVEAWDACQVLSISQLKTSNEREPSSSLCSLEVRPFRNTKAEEDPRVPIKFVSESTDDDSPTHSVPLSRVLGPLTLGVRELDKFQWSWKNMIRFLPASPLVFATQLNFNTSEDLEMYLLTRAIEQSKEYRQGEKEEMNAIMLPRKDDDSSKGSQHSSTKTSETQLEVENVNSLYTDNLSGTTYFRSVNVKPNFERYHERFKPPHDNVRWRVSMGDIVMLGAKDCFGRRRFGPISNWVTYSKTDPFKEPSAVGEIVSIFRLGGSPTHQIKIEVRWLYGLNELLGKVLPKSGDSNSLSEELLETDHYDMVDPSSLLAPAILHENPVDVTIAERTLLGMPLLEFYCFRFFSVKRMAPVPCGSLSGRIARGRLMSSVISRDAILSEKLERDDSASALFSKPAPLKDWRDNYAKVISKLSLSDASKEGFEGIFVMVGRENERKKINSFLKGAVMGTGKESASSIFIAGPPGTGKTASVFAAVREMRTKHVSKRFNFVYMNGMEMRHPFEAYVMLWEKLGGKSQCKPEAAAAKLENYFTDDYPDLESEVTVVLLDEIDYLVTKNQSVLYNFFDWPLRSTKRRLVLLGISNTLNLPEHLHPRVQSRIGNRRCIFNAYTSDQINSILKSKVTQASPQLNVFATDALVFASKKTSAQSGDLRKAFRICRLAAEQVLNENPNPPEAPIVGIKDVLKVSRESFHSAHSKAVALCSQFEALVLVVLALLYRSTGREVGGFDVEELVLKMEAISNAWGNTIYLPPPSLAETLGLLRRLGEINLVSLRSQRTSSVSCRASLAGSGGPWPLVSLLVEDTAVFHALKSTCHKELAQKYLGR